MSDEVFTRLEKEIRNVSDRLIVIETKMDTNRSDEKDRKDWREQVDKRIQSMEQLLAEQKTYNRILGIIGATSLAGLVSIAIKVIFG